MLTGFFSINLMMYKIISKNLTFSGKFSGNLNLLSRFLSFPFFVNTAILLRILLHNTREGDGWREGGRYLLEGVRWWLMAVTRRAVTRRAVTRRAVTRRAVTRRAVTRTAVTCRALTCRLVLSWR